MIGIFDSGVGGLSVFREIREMLPDHHLIYLADTAFAPYGDRTLEEVRHRSGLIVNELRSRGARLVVVACHTASAAALHALRGAHPDLPIVGLEPAVKPAAARTATRSIGVLATTATFQGELFRSVVERFGSGTRVIARPCPGLADLIEVGASDDDIEAAIRVHTRVFADRNIDQIVLGCTHYSFIADRIREVTGADVIDPAPAVAAQAGRLAPPPSGRAAEILVTGDAPAFLRRANELIGLAETALPISLPT